jgi:NAD(P)-dependent dehydrogenase (short-subunit alcohol dehydrogenase family)
LTTKTVLIIGSSSGIDLTKAKNFAGKVCNIIFNGLETNGEQISQETMQQHNNDYLFYPSNLLSPNQIKNKIGYQMKANNLSRKEVKDKIMLAKQAIKSFIPIENIALSVAILAAYDAATITKISITKDGGWTVQ